jgi:hypothetical protein
MTLADLEVLVRGAIDSCLPAPSHLAERLKDEIEEVFIANRNNIKCDPTWYILLMAKSKDPIRAMVSERMFNDSDYPEGDIEKCIEIYESNVAYTKEQK